MKKIIPALLTLLAITSAGCRPQAYQVSEGVIWHTTYRIEYDATRNLDDEILSAMRRVEMSLSPFQQKSLISKINRGETDSVDTYIALIFENSQLINRESAGAFDPTVAPLINLWGFGYEKSGDEPTQEQIDSCMQAVGIADCRIDSGRIVKKSPDTQFNFSAITKGFGCDEVARTLREHGARNFLVEIGGELMLQGNNPKGEPWRIMVDAPTVGPGVVHEELTTLQITDCGIATSGNYRNYRESADGTRYGHTISPTTGRPVSTETLSVTVIAPTAMEADALATSCMAMPFEEALAMLERLNCRALFVLTPAPDSTDLRLLPLNL